jgi:20S proteasome subunit beta 4
MTMHACAHYIRSELAKALRSRGGAHRTNILLGGVDFLPDSDKVVPSLYFLDYIGSLAKVKYSAHGYCGYFALATLDRYWKPNMSVAEARELLGTIIQQLHTRFMINMPRMIIKTVSKEGITEEIVE